MNDEYSSELTDLAAMLGLPAKGCLSASFPGSEPPLPGPHKLSMAASLAVASSGMAAATVWELRTGKSQRVEVDVHTAHNAICTGLWQSIGGHNMSIALGAAAAVSGFYQTADDRWIYLMGTYPHLRDGILKLLDCANHTDAIAAAVRRWPGMALEEAVAALGLSAAVVRSREEWLLHEQGALLAATPLVTIDKVAEGPVMALNHAERPLSGVRVLDFTHVIAGPVLSRTLAEHGAQVLHVGSPRHQDPLEFSLDTGWGKRSAYLGLQHPEDMNRMRDLLSTTDVFVQSWRPGALSAHGLSPKALAVQHPGLIFASVSAYGSVGPWAGRKGFEQLAQAVTGVAVDEGGSGKPRFVPTVLLNDYLAGYLGAAGVMAALARRAREGGSYSVHVNLAGCSMWLQRLGSRSRGADAPLPDVSELLVERETPFGLLRHLPPFCRMSETPCRWDLPPAPPGQHRLAWV